MENRNVDFKYSVLQDSEYAEVVEFYNSIHNSTRNVDKFKWEFVNSVFGKAICIIARDKTTNRIIGTQSAIPIQFITSRGEVIMTAKSEDTIVDPNFRGQKIFDFMYDLLISESKKNGIEYIWGFTSAIKPFKKLGFDIPFLHSQSVFVISIKNSYFYLSSLSKEKALINKMKIFILVLLSKLNSIFKNLFTLNSSKDFEFEVITKIDEEYEHEIKNISNYKNNWLSINRSIPFLNWRITKNPYALSNFIIKVKKESQLKALIFFTSNVKGIWFIIEEFYADDLSLKQKGIILKYSIKLLRSKMKDSVDLIRTWDFKHNENSIELLKIKKEACFLQINRGIPFVWLCISNNNMVNVNDLILSRASSQGMS